MAELESVGGQTMLLRSFFIQNDGFCHFGAVSINIRGIILGERRDMKRSMKVEMEWRMSWRANFRSVGID